MNFTKYEKYKDSGLEWLGKIPEDLGLVRLKALIKQPLSYGANESALLDNKEFPRFIRITDFSDNGLLKDETFKSLEPSVAEKYLLREKDILFARSGATAGKTFLFTKYEGKACFAGYLIKARVNRKKLKPKFLYYFTKSSVYENWKNHILIKATIENISAEKYGFFLFVPTFDLDSQAEIIKYLDEKTAQIDKKIELLQAKKEKYQELRKTLINEAVTKGIDKNVEFKDSGVSWIGEFPKHWEIKRLKDVGKAIIGLTYSPLDLVTSNEKGILVLRSSNIQNDKIDFSDNVYVNKEIPRQLLTRVGDILICSRNGSRRLIGKNICIDSNSAGLTFGAFMTVFRSKNYKFISKFFNSQLFDFQSGAFMTSTINQLTINTLNNLLIAFPPIKEQTEITNYLDEKTSKIDQIILKIDKNIETLNEFRKTLINDAVTGKIKITQSENTPYERTAITG